MQTPKRKSGKYANQKVDTHMTIDKYQELKANLKRLKETIRPRALKEMQKQATGGDFSENAGYQASKGKVRGINRRMDWLENMIKYAQIIEVNKNANTVQVGHSATVQINGKNKTFQILGSTETDPSAGVISHKSPLGTALLGSRVGEVIEVKIGERVVDCKIMRIK